MSDSNKPLVGENPALDLINTRARTSVGVIDFLATPDNLSTWLDLQPDARLHAFRAADAGALTMKELDLLYEVRDCAATTIDHRRRNMQPPGAALDGLNKVWRMAAPVQQLAWENGQVAITTHRDGPFAARLASTLAGLTAELLADPRSRNIRQCEAPDCVMLFLPLNARRRWCSASGCGNRARVARYYRRHKA